MGKFKEINIELIQWVKDKKNTTDMLSMQYPFMYFHIQQAFDLGDESSVYDIIFALEDDTPPC